jgi:hypothetical protein
VRALRGPFSMQKEQLEEVASYISTFENPVTLSILVYLSADHHSSALELQTRKTKQRLRT